MAALLLSFAGGSQSDAVSISPFSRGRVLGYRWPANETLPEAAPLARARARREGVAERGVMDYPFTTDGCSGGHSARWKFFFGVEPPWEGCCVEHDKAYWRGGTREERSIADGQLWNCVAGLGHPVWAFILWAAVRAGGHPLLPLPWRWGYGWKYPRPYSSALKY